jgi:pimeloyl-ACP methyl ester carboxylesterase
MPIVASNGIEICFDEFGSAEDPAILLVRGFGSQMIAWRDAFCQKLADSGFRVIRYDNRDTGLSSKIDDGTKYGLNDMAADGIGVLDHLGIDKAHVCGLSMGGMIVQLMAIEHPDRVLSMVSIMSAIGGRDAVLATGDALRIFSDPVPPTREERIEQDVTHRRIIGSTGDLFDEAEVRALATESYDRSFYPKGKLGQMHAIQNAPSRREALGELTIPVAVIHGTIDPLVPVENGRITADAIPGAELVLIDGMGHDIPAGAWDTVIDAIVSNARRV